MMSINREKPWIRLIASSTKENILIILQTSLRSVVMVDINYDLIIV